MSRTLFTADQHFGHENVIRFCSRPFASVDEMDQAVVDCWNAVVKRHDTVWCLGDFAYRAEPKRVAAIFGKLNGSKHLIVGNHDKQATKALPWASVGHFAEVGIDGQRAVLSHYAMRTWPGQRRGAVMLYGHSHGKLPGSRGTLDVGVDSVGYAPVDMPSILSRMSELPLVSYAQGHEILDLAEDDEDDEDALTV